MSTRSRYYRVFKRKLDKIEYNYSYLYWCVFYETPTRKLGAARRDCFFRGRVQKY